ncbi:MAG: hypothetical protein U5K69_03355 [Balneolaceae bacterium]|nr:hypothetical protein [Balneolaceae bacterium]
MKIIIVGQETQINETLMELLAAQPGFTVKMYTPEMLENQGTEIRETEPDLLILDISGYDKKPVECVEEIKEKKLSKALIAMHVYTAPNLIKPLIEAGADGYLPSSTTEEELLTAIETINKGQNYPEL